MVLTLEQKLLKTIQRCYPVTISQVNKIFKSSGSFDRTIAIIEQGLERSVDPVILATSSVKLKMNNGQNVLQYFSRDSGEMLYEMKVA